MISCRVLLHSNHTIVIPFKTNTALSYFLDEVATQENPEDTYYSWECSVKVKNIAKVISIEEEN